MFGLMFEVLCSAAFSEKNHHDRQFVFQVHDIFHPFIQTSDDEITFIAVNESKTGFCHLYKITSVLQPGSYSWAKGYTHSEGNAINKHRLIVQVCQTKCPHRASHYFI